MGSTAPLATADDVASRLGRDLTDSEAIRAEVLLADASALIRRYCRQDFLHHVAEVIPAQYGRNGEIRLSERPVQSIQSVTAIGAPQLGLPNLPVPWYTFDGVDTIALDPGWGSIINLPAVWWTDAAYPGTFDVIATFGPPDIPPEVTMVAANEVIGILTAPTQGAGVIGETIGPYSYRMERSGGGLMVALTQAGKESLADFRGGEGTTMLRLR
jgi:hypothetical protein